MCISRAYVILAIVGLSFTYVLAQLDCDLINLSISTDRNTTNGTSMAYTGQSTNIRCDFSCNITCVKSYVYWRKEGQVVYRLDWTGNPSGPELGYENRTRLVVSDDVNGIYIMEWNDTDWEDLPSGQTYTTWDCLIWTDICISKEERTEVQYFKQPYLSMYANEELLQNFTDIQTDNGKANCTVISHPDSRITMLLGDDVQPDASSCSPFSQHEFSCSVEVPEADFTKGFECKVMYNSPETGEYEEVNPDGCCPGGLYPTNPPTKSPPETLQGWEIGLIVIGCLAAVGLLVTAGVIYYKKHQGSGASN